MEKEVKNDIIKILIPIIGIWWLIINIIPDFREITWWDYGKYSLLFRFGLVLYQMIWYGLLNLLLNYYDLNN
jgi:hypothetical protein